MSVTEETTPRTADDAKPTVHWGAEGIGKRINRSKRAAFNLLETGKLEGAVKIAGRWALTERAAQKLFGE